MTKKILIDETVVKQALEALESTGRFLHHCWCDVQMNEYSFDKLNKQMEIVDAEITALRGALEVNNKGVNALAEPQAAEPNAILVEGFSQVALRKLNGLREKGYAVNGVSIATISEAGETQLGAVTTGGRVLWWGQPQAAEPVDGALDRTLKERDDAEDFIDALLDEVLGNNRPEWSSAYGRSDALNDVRERLAQQAAEPVAPVRSDAVNLARNMLEVRDCKGITSHGVRVLCEAVMQMDKRSMQQAAEPVARCPQDIIDAITAYGDARADQDAINAPTTSHERLADCIRLVRGVLTKQMAPTASPGARHD